MSDVGQMEKLDQDAVIRFFREGLGYRYLGDLRHGDNRNIREDNLRGWLKQANNGHSEVVINKAVGELVKTSRIESGGSKTYPPAISDSKAKQALYDNLDHDEDLAIAVHNAVEDSRKAKWLGNTVKESQIRYAIKDALKDQEELVEQTFEIVKNQPEYRR